MEIKIRVPATTANLGVGFDTLGLALQKYAYFTFKKSDQLVIEGCPAKYATEENLVYRSYQIACQAIGYLSEPIHLQIDTEIPISRGLGSSASCVVAGVMAAFYLNEVPFDLAKALTLATKIEGHPDNVAPALLGGLIASTLIDEKVWTAQYPIHPTYHFLLLIPDFSTETQAARKVLPSEFSFETAVAHNGKLALLFHALANEEPEMLKKVMVDEWHEPYRKQLIAEYEEVKQICTAIDSGGFYISGSGSTLVNILLQTTNVPIIEEKLQILTHNWQAELVQIDKKGASIC